MYFTYVLLCKGKATKLYVGSCANLENRVKEHIAKEVKSTRVYDTISLIYYEACLNKTDAIKRERQLKTGFGRGYLKRRLEQYFKARV